MKIGIIGSQLNLKSINKQFNQPSPSLQTQTVNSSCPQKIPASAYLSNSAIAFGIKLPGSQFRDIPCAYCNKIVIPSDIYSNLKWPERYANVRSEKLFQALINKAPDFSVQERQALNQLGNLCNKHPETTFSRQLDSLHNCPRVFNEILKPFEVPQSEYNEQLFQTIEPYTEYMHDTQKEAYYKLRELNQKTPNKHFYELLQTLRPKHLAALKESESKLMSELIESVNYIEKNQKGDNDLMELKSNAVKEIKTVITEAMDLIESQQEMRPFRRGTFITKINEILKPLPEEDKDVLTIKRTINNFPDSQTNLDAFVVKYSDRAIDKKTKEWHHRTSKEIARNLIYPSTDTADHMNAANRNTVGPHGETAPRNLLHTCQCCNGHKENEKFKIFLKIKTGAWANIQKQMKYFIDKANKGLMDDGYEYVKDIAENAKTSTDGEFILNFKKLNSETNKSTRFLQKTYSDELIEQPTNSKIKIKKEKRLKRKSTSY